MTDITERKYISSLYDSHICRLCGQKNDIGYLLYATNSEDEDLSEKINAFLPIRISNDGKYPRWICPGCHLQVESTVQFFTLILSGQNKLRELYRKEQEQQSSGTSEVSDVNNDVNYNDSELKYEEYYCEDYELQELDKEPTVKRKRGRPRKTEKSILDLSSISLQDDPTNFEQDSEEDLYDENGVRRKRRTKVPSRFKEVVQGKELDKVYAEMGIEEGIPFDPIVKDNGRSLEEQCEKVIGYMQDSTGKNLGDLVMINRIPKKNKTKNHIKQNTRLVCDVCKIGFWKEKKFFNHWKTHQNVLFECTECLQSYKDRASLVQHQTTTSHLGEGIIEMFESLPEESPNKDCKQTTENIPLEFKEENELTLKNVLDMITIHPGATIDHQSQLDIVLSEPNVQASEMAPIDEVFKEIREIEVNKVLGEVQNIQSSEQNHPTVINFDLNCFDSPDNNSDSIKQTIPVEIQDSGNNYTCKQCGNVYNNFSQYVEHKNTAHTTGRRFVCSKCNKIFSSKIQVQRHQLVHSKNREYQCELCGAAFKTKTTLSYHRAIHDESKKFSCQICARKFVHKRSLHLHMDVHAGSKPYACPHCNKRFAQLGNMQEHLRIHTGERPFSCSICPKTFKTSSQVRIHTKRHEVIRPLKCTKCTKSFVRPEELRVHVRRHYNIKPYCCTQCKKSFIDQAALSKHQLVHTGEKPFSCSDCNRCFADRSNLRKHMKIHENKKQILDIMKNHENDLIEEELFTESETKYEGGIVMGEQFIGDTSSLLIPPGGEQIWSITNSTVLDTAEVDGNSTLGKLEPIEESSAEQVVYVTYQDPNNPIGNKTFYLVQ